jgi:pyruvate/2-oxoglutarate dehydrogenase complex dihydrolipoamide acyltransferase (E2) component
MSDQIKKLSQLGKAMGKHMTASWEAPQFQLETEVDCARLIEYRNTLDFKPSFTTIIAKAVADTLKKFPQINASWGGDCIVLHDDINIGIAADTGRGLLVPVIKDAENKSIAEMHEAMEHIKSKSERGNFSIEDMSGGTFTISNLGIFNITSFKAIVNAPEAGILAVSKMTDTPVVRNGQIVPAKIMRLNLSLDHRVTDGATGARFLTELATVLESL